jgi:two-component system OmpR family sensor kinase
MPTRVSDLFHTTLRWRFTLWISAVLFLSVGVSFVIIYHDTTTRLRSQIEHDLRADTAQLEASLRLLQNVPHPSIVDGARSYVAAQSFRSISTLLFVLVGGRAGVEPISNYPELFALSEPDDGESIRAQAAENALTRRLRSPILGLSTQSVPDIGDVRLYERPITVAGQRLTIGAGESLVTVARAQRGIVKSFLLAGVFTVIAVLIGTYLVGTRVTAPLRRMARVAERVDAGELEPRMAPGGRDEVGVLATTFNHMLERLDEAFQAQRAFVADASHELRTPLTVVQGQLEVLANRRDIDRDEVRRVERLVHGEIARMRRIVDDLLLLAQTERPDFLYVEEIELGRFLEQLRDDATLIADRRFELGTVPDGQLEADPDRLAQALRNLINNAIDHTTAGSGVVRLEVSANGPGDEVRISVLDDGPGIPPDQVERIFDRFHRAGPERASEFGGAGLGLAIVRAITEAHGGRVAASNNAGSGARFDLWLPGFTPPD